MEENKEIIMSFCIATLIPIIYMIFYLIKGKEKSILAFFKALLGTLVMYISSIIPIMLIVIRWSDLEQNDFMGGIILDVLSIMFSIPLLAELIKCIRRDFKLPNEFESNLVSKVIITVVTCVLTFALIVFTKGFIAGDVSIFALIAIIYMFVAMILMIIIRRLKIKFAEDYEKLEKIKKNEQKIGIALSIFMILFFIALMIF